MLHSYVCISHLATSVNFSQSVYSIIEDKGSVPIVLILSNPSAYDTTITVFSSDGSANGKFNVNSLFKFSGCLQNCLNMAMKDLISYLNVLN